MSTSIACLKKMVGNTPLLKIKYTYKDKECQMFIKAENFNMTGSIKDRMALHVLEKSYENGSLKKGDRIIEATSGNTGISFSAIGKALGHDVTIYMPNWMSAERINLIKSFGADIVLVTKEEGGFLGSIAMTKELAKKEDNTFLPCQFDNNYNVEAHYLTTGKEIFDTLNKYNITPDAFVAGVGTGGTVMGTGKRLKEEYPAIQIHPLEPSNSPTLSTGHKVGKHRIQGVSDEFIPSIVKLNEMDSVVEVDDGDSIIMAQKLCNTLGLGVGISSGANFLGAIKLQQELGFNKNVVTIFSDSNKKYLSTDLMKEELVKEEFLSTDIKPISFEVM